MKVFTDVKYAQLLRSSLKNFKRKGNYLWNFSCPICGDSAKQKTKARGYFYEKHGNLNFFCHNCSASMSFGNFLKKHSPNIFKEYCLEKFGESKDRTRKKKPKDIVHKKPTFIRRTDIGLTSIENLPNDHIVKKYVIKRKIPKSYHRHLYYTTNFRAWCIQIFPFEQCMRSPEDARLIIPFFDKLGNLFAVQGRSLKKNSDLKYVTVKADENVPLIFGLDRWDKNKTTYVVEGPFDSMFLPNSLAATGSDLSSVMTRLKTITNYEMQNLVYIFDNERRNKEIVRLMFKAIDTGNKICIWPETVIENDINDMILSGQSPEEILDVINKSSWIKLEATVNLSTWRRC